MHKLLIVDDESGIVDEVKDFFAEEGFDVHTADSGHDGIKMIGALKPDILVLDMKLPDISGLDVLKFCKEHSPKTKVIVVTGYVDQGMIDKAEQLGRDSFLQKPFDLTFLIDEVNRLLGI
jgi:two-component system, response regulator, stage 0 sporulation protein F